MPKILFGNVPLPLPLKPCIMHDDAPLRKALNILPLKFPHIIDGMNMLLATYKQDGMQHGCFMTYH